MIFWSGSTDDGEFTLELEDSVVMEIGRLCDLAHPSETGGILIGRYSPDMATATVVEATAPPPDSRQGPSWFRRGVSGLQVLLLSRWKAADQSFYIGEWHYHPAAKVNPSIEDFRQMVSISREKNYQCQEPLMLIFGAQKDSLGRRVFRAFVIPLEDETKEFIRTDVVEC